MSVLFLCGIAACKKDKDDKIIRITAEGDVQSNLQSAFITAEDGYTIELAAGTYNFTNTLSIDGKSNFTVRGAGKDQTFLSFDGQTTGAEGVIATNCSQILFQGFEISETPGDAIKVKNSDGVTFYEVAATWENTGNSTNGAYGIYPVSCTNVLIDQCYVRGASDAGIYVGQSDKVIVRNSTAEYNVAGFEIENTTNADVHTNIAMHNTGGILVFDLPNLPVKNGGFVRVYNNMVEDNSLKNFAPPANVVSNVPSGTGIMLMSADNVEVFDNTIRNNNVMGVGIVSYAVFGYLNPDFAYNDPAYEPYSYAIYIHDNQFTRTNDLPEENNSIANLVALQFPDGNIPDILYDGLTETTEGYQGNETTRICLNNNGAATFVDLDVEFFFADMSLDIEPYVCQRQQLVEVTVNAPEAE